MEHKTLDLEYDEQLLNRILDNTIMRYIISFQYIIRNDLFQDLQNETLIDSYNRVLNLDEIYKGNLLSFWNQAFIEVAIDLGLIKNIRSIREFEQKDQDFVIKLGEETITIEHNTISVPADILFIMISKKFKSINRRDYNLAISRLKSVRCESTGIIHPFIYQIGAEDYSISDDLYYILDQFGNVYQAIKIENTIEGFYQRFNEINKKVKKYIEIFDPILTNKKTLKKIKEAIEKKKEIIAYLHEEKIDLTDKFKYENIDKNSEIFNNWHSQINKLLEYQFRMDKIEHSILDVKKYYSGKDKKYAYLEFIEKVSFNEENIVDNIRKDLVYLKELLVEINDFTSNLSEKDIKLLNLDYERFLITNS